MKGSSHTVHKEGYFINNIQHIYYENKAMRYWCTVCSKSFTVFNGLFTRNCFGKILWKDIFNVIDNKVKNILTQKIVCLYCLPWLNSRSLFNVIWRTLKTFFYSSSVRHKSSSNTYCTRELVSMICILLNTFNKTVENPEWDRLQTYIANFNSFLDHTQTAQHVLLEETEL